MRFEDIYAAVGPEEGQAAGCPKCQAAEGGPCRYVAGSWLNSQSSLTRPGAHAKGRRMLASPGDPMPGVHPERKAVIRERRLQQYRSEQAAERAALRAWWRENGHIFESAGG